MPQESVETARVPYASTHTASMEAETKPLVLAHVFYRHRYRLLQLVLDTLAVGAAWSATFELRAVLNPWMPIALTRAQLLAAAPPLSAVIILWMLAAAYRGLYSSRGLSTASASLARAAESAIVAGALTIIVTFFSRQVGAHLSRSFVLLFAPLSFLMMAAAHYLALVAAVLIERRWPAPERVAVVGAGARARGLVDRLRSAGGSGLAVSGVILPPAVSAEDLGNPVPVLGRLPDLAALINRHGLDRLIIADGHLTERQMEECAGTAKRMGVVASRAFPSLGPSAQVSLSELYGLHLLELRGASFTRGQEWLKRAFDIVAAGLLLIALSPLLVGLAILIKLSSPGPVLYKAPRVGRGGHHFVFLKFRSMYHGQNERRRVAGRNEKTGHVFKIRNDPRVTPLGRFMRRYSLDELPQFVNVLLGQMSLVGPRPLPTEDLELDGQSKDFAVWTEQRSRVAPGITGLWQISGRSELPFEKWVDLDIRYIRNWSFGLDLRILIETPLVVLTGRGAC